MSKNNIFIAFPENRELKKQLRKGDMIEIARLSGLKISYIRNIFGGYRNNAEAVVWAKRLINDRNLRMEQISNPSSQK